VATTETTCCIVGAGPAGALLALLLPRGGVDVVIREQHRHWDREFRGEGVQPGAIDLFEELGILEGVLGLPHQLVDSVQAFRESGNPLFTGPIRDMLEGRRHPYVMLLPQAPFLAWCAAQATATGRCRVLMGAGMRELLIEGDGDARRVNGVRHRGAAGEGAVRARPVVGCDGRHSNCRREAVALAVETISEAPPLDILWAAVPLDAIPGLPEGDAGVGGVWLREHPETGLAFYFPAYGAEGERRLRVGWTIPHGTYPAVKERGFDAWRGDFVRVAPQVAPLLDQVGDWHSVSLLSVVVQRASRWWVPGLLLLGDAAHTASPVGGQGPNMALVDAAVAAEVLLQPLLSGAGGNAALDLALARIERRREPAARGVMRFQAQSAKALEVPGFVLHTALYVAPYLGRR
jgi:2-polyprenyl-6-methoxyphenol hydroxylase-like FAD-dependent oxidoreductase